MKKVIALGLTGVMLMASLTGCGTSSKYLLDVKYSKYVKLCKYEGIEATKVTYDVTDEEVQEQIEQNMYEYVTFETIKDRGITAGDYANIDYIATLDGEELEDYSGEGEDVYVGEGYIYPELEEALEGMEKGDKKTVEVELTEEYAEEEYVGKKISIDVTVNEISIEVIPEYNKEFVEDNTDFESMEDYEASVKEELMESKAYDYESVAYEEIMAYIIDNSKFKGYPEELYNQCKENYDSMNEFYASLYQMEVEEYLEACGLDEEAQKEEIEANVNYELVIGAIAQKEKIDCTEEEVNAYIEENYAEYGYESAEELLEDYTEEEIGYELLYEKVMEFLYNNATYKEMSEEEYLESLSEDSMYDLESEDIEAVDDELVDEDEEEAVEVLEEETSEEEISEEETSEEEASEEETSEEK